jgi:hypothetical protein
MDDASFSPGNFRPKITRLKGRHPPYCSVSRLKIKLKGRHFDTTEVREAESQAVLNSLTEHDSRMHLETAEPLGTVRTRRSGSWPVGPQLLSDEMAALRCFTGGEKTAAAFQLICFRATISLSSSNSLNGPKRAHHYILGHVRVAVSVLPSVN